MPFDLEHYFHKALPHIKKWWFSVLCVPFCWVLADQFWMALKWDITFAWLYQHPFFLSPFFFFIDNFLLIIHEAGHSFFSIFGSRFLTILGGTILEILIPVMIFLYGWWNYQRFVAQLGILLTSFAWIESSAYAADAVSRRMPLIGNLPKSSHDFYNLFSLKGVLNDYMIYAWGMYWIGILLLALFLFYPMIEPERHESVEIDLDL